MGSDSRSSSVASDDKADRPDRKRKHSFGDSVDEKRVRPATVKVALVSNIPYETPWQDLKDIFRKFVGDGVVNVELFTDERGRSKGLSLVTFRSREITTRAIEKVNGYELKNRFLVVREYTDEERRRRERLEQKLDPKHRVITALNHVLPSEESFRERRDLIDSRDRHLIERERDIISRERETLSRDAMAKAELASLVTRILNTDVSQLKAMGVHESVIETVRSGNLSNTIFVANLAFHVKPFEVKEIFSLVGYVVRVKLAEDDKGRSKGYGIVEFETPLEALEAVSRFDNQKLYGRDMRVRMDKYQSTDVGSSSLPQGLEGLGSSLTSTLGFRNLSCDSLDLVPSKSARTDYLRPAIADRLDSRDLGHRDSERRGDFDSMRSSPM